MALDTFLSPDPASRTKDHEGRRIEEIDGGWLILNGSKFDSIRSAEERREYMREYQRKRRETLKESKLLTPVNNINPNNPSSSSSSTNSISKSKEKEKATPADFRPPVWIDPKAWAGFVEMRKRERHPLTQRACEIIVKKLDVMMANGHDPNAVLDQSTANGWRGVFEIKQDRPTAKAPLGKTATAIHELENLKNERRRADHGADAAPSLHELGRPAGSGTDPRDR
jgi:hypothetical protein